MGFKKKRNVVILTLCMIVSYILYQLYFFSTISSEGSKIISVFDVKMKDNIKPLHSQIDKYISDIGVIKGIRYSFMAFYIPNSKNQFKCVYSEQWIPFDFVNDDYCDCADSTDEPSTSACPNGTFYCDTQYSSKNVEPNKIPSNKVNDGICDCCDGSDEWLHIDDIKLLSQGYDTDYRQYVDKCSSNCYK